jgi:hypothetical protein
MNNYKKDSAAKGKELFISNYKTKHLFEKTSSKAIEQLSLF